jgi:hypothetical protein
MHGGGDTVSESTATAPIPVRATIWAIDLPHEQAAARHLTDGRWPGSGRFNLRGVAKTEPGGPCPLDPAHPEVLASKQGRGWMWVLHAPEVCAPLAVVEFEHDGDCACLDGGAAGLLERGTAR